MAVAPLFGHLAASCSTNLWCQEHKLQMTLLPCELQQRLGGNSPVDGIHKHVKLIHGPEGALGILAQRQDEGNCCEGSLSTCRYVTADMYTGRAQAHLDAMEAAGHLHGSVQQSGYVWLT